MIKRHPCRMSASREGELFQSVYSMAKGATSSLVSCQTDRLLWICGIIETTTVAFKASAAAFCRWVYSKPVAQLVRVTRFSGAAFGQLAGADGVPRGGLPVRISPGVPFNIRATIFRARWITKICWTQSIR